MTHRARKPVSSLRNWVLACAASLVCAAVAHGQTEQLYVSNYGSDTVGLYSTSGATLNASLITGLDNPMGITINPATGYIYVANNGTGEIGEYSPSGTTLNAAYLGISGSQQTYLAVNSLDNTLWYNIIGGSSFSTLNLKNFSGNYVFSFGGFGVTEFLDINISPVSGNSFYITSNGTSQFTLVQYGFLYMSGGLFPGPVFGTVTSASLPGLSDPGGLAISPLTGNVYIADSTLGTIGEYTPTGDTVNASLISGLSDPRGLAISALTGNIFVANFGAGTIGEYTSSGGVVNASLVSGLNNPYGVALATVPEPAIWASLAGITVLGLALTRRRLRG